MQFVKPDGAQSGFRVVGLEQILPEAVEVCEYRRAGGYRSKSHSHSFWQGVFLVEGTLSVGVEQGPETVLKRGSLVCIPAGLTYWAQFGPESRHYVLSVGLHLHPIELRHPEWMLSQSLDRVYLADGLMELESHFLKIIREVITPTVHQTVGLQLAVDALVLQVLRAIVGGNPAVSLATVHPAISKALTILETRFRETWTVNQLAREVGLSSSRLAELFDQKLGDSIHKFLTKIRVRQAESLLRHSGLSIGEIASECGFASIYHFSRIFREINGNSPSKFRRR
jgi:AraC-like DNA-binding protein/quercetin dioxygenase-like cupin family protein